MLSGVNMLILFVTCLLLIPSLTQTADDALTPLAQSVELMQLREPETPDEFMQQLRRAERAMQEPADENDPFQLFGKKHTEALKGYKKSYQYGAFSAIYNFMQKLAYADFHDYFMALAKSPLPNKTDDVFVKIPFLYSARH